MRGLFLLAVLGMVSLSLAGCHGVPESSDRGAGIGAAGSAAMSQALLDWTKSIPAGDPAPQPIGDCTALLHTLNARALEETENRLDGAIMRGGLNFVSIVGERMPAPTAMPAANTPMASTGGTTWNAATAEVTGTNNQETGVDEADILKTDGEWTYVLQQGHLYILHSDEVGDIAEHVVLKIGEPHTQGSLLLERRDPDNTSDDRLIIITQEGDPTAAPAEERDEDEARVLRLIPLTGYTHIQILDLADRQDPQRIKEMWIEGHDMAARLVDGHANFVVHRHGPSLPLQGSLRATEEDLAAHNITWQEYHEMNATERRPILDELANRTREENRRALENITLGDHLPTIYRPTGNGTQERMPTEQECRRYLSTENATGRSISTILALSVANETIEESSRQIVGSRPIVYGATDALILAAPIRDTWWFQAQADRREATDIHWFDLDGLAIEPRASGRVPGIVRDSFGIDVHDGMFRVITVTGQWGRMVAGEREPTTSHLAIFEETDGGLALVGKVGGIAPGENLWSARFTDTRAYLITFEQTDPLWVIDLSDPYDPTILGELEIPGVSTYIHPLSDDLLLTVGYGPRDGDTGLDWGRIQINLFDISDPEEPTRADVLDVSKPGDQRGRSAALHEHKAFTYWDRLGMLSIPLSVDRNQSAGQPDAGLRLIEVDAAERSLGPYGQIDQDHWIDNTTKIHWWTAQIQRSYFLGHVDDGIVSVYVMSGLGITAHDLATLEPQDSVRFRTVDPYGP